MIPTPATGHTGGDLHRVTGWGDMDDGLVPGVTLDR